MKPKTLVLLMVVLVVLAGAGALLMYSHETGSTSGEMGAFLFEQLPANDITSIVIETSTSAVTLKKGADGWIVAERYGYPADFSRISDLVRTLKKIKIGRSFGASDEVLKRLSLKSPASADTPESERGTSVRMSDGEGQTVLQMTLGSTRTRDRQKGPPDGQYVMLQGTPQVYLIDTILSAYEGGPARWLEKRPVHVDGNEISRITCLGPGGTDIRYVLERPAKGKNFELMSPSTGRKLKRSSVNRLSNALSSLKISDVEPVSGVPKPLGPEASPRLDYALFDGRVYHVFPGTACSATIPCRIRFEVGFEKPESEIKDVGGAGPGKDRGSAETPSDATPTDKAAEEDKRLKSWIFTLPEWQHQAFFIDLGELLENEPEKKDVKRGPGKLSSVFSLTPNKTV